MSDQTSQEPTMEEILASIRRIISEDEAPAEAGAAPPAAAPEPEPADTGTHTPFTPAAAAPAELPSYDAPEAEDDTLELTEKVETMGDLDVLPASASPASDPEPLPDLQPAAMAHEAAVVSAGLVSEQAASAAATQFGRLSATIGMPRSDRTLEDVVREMLNPLLQQWLDDNLPRIVQEAVDAEVARISRGRVG